VETTSTPDYPRGITFEQVWAAIHADREAAKASHEEFERNLKASREEFERGLKASREERERELKASRKEFNKRMKKNEKKYDEIFGRLGNRIGDFIERMVEPNLLKKFRALGYNFSKISRDLEFWFENRKLAEVDVSLENGDAVVAVEVRSKTSFDDINEHLERMDKLRIYADSKNDRRKYLGAVGGMVFNDGIKDYALKCGLYVIEPIGNTFDVIAPEGKYKPREW